MTTPDSDLIRPSFLPHLMTRRTLLAASGAIAGVGLLGYRASGQDATPIAGQATPIDGSPVASPIASPIATEPTALPGPEMIGQLTIVRDQRPIYEAKPVRGGQLTIVRVGTTNLDYNPASFAQDFQIPATYLEPLVWIDGVTMEPRPWLAESWEWNDNHTEITYTLRDDVRWHDAEKLTARDVAFSFEVYRDDIFSSVYTFFTNMSSVQAVDDRTVMVRLDEPDGNWIRNSSSQLIFQREQYGPFWDVQPVGQKSLTGFNWDEAPPVGTGPWAVTGFRDSRVEFRANRKYWGNSPYATALRADFVKDSATQLQRWHDGGADLIWPVTPTDLSTISDRPGKLYVAETTTVMFAAFNFNNPARVDPTILTDLRLRQALSLGIKRSRYATELFTGFFNPDLAGTIIQPDLYLDGIVNPEHDVLAARNLIEDAGFTAPKEDGFFRYSDGTALKFEVIVRRGDDPRLESILDSIAVDLQEIGVVLDVRRLSPERFNSVWLDEHGFDLIAFSYSLYPGFTDFDLYGSAWDIRTNIQGLNPGGYDNEKVNRAIERALTATSDAEYLSALHAVQRQVNDEDLFALWFGSPMDLILAQSDIHGFQPNKVWQTLESNKLWRS